MTTVLGAADSLIGTWLSHKLGYSNENGGFKIIPFLVGIIVAVILIATYLGSPAAGAPCAEMHRRQTE
jgi:uncharacterized membrane protein YeaQ/YmgE (transglycosylase-associated protein family)